MFAKLGNIQTQLNISLSIAIYNTMADLSQLFKTPNYLLDKTSSSQSRNYLNINQSSRQINAPLQSNSFDDL